MAFERAGPVVKRSPFLSEAEEGRSAYTHLFAWIIEEEGSFTVQVRLSSNSNAESTAWGEEVTDCFETACMLISTLAAEFSISTDRVKIELRMDNSREGTRH
ncbi:MAG TPA: hypothetical protein VH678_11240 [Xanthobacteraceae bacterium]